MDYFHTIKLHKIKYLGPDFSAFGTQEKYILKVRDHDTEQNYSPLGSHCTKWS